MPITAGLILILTLGLLAYSADARLEIRTPQQKAKLAEADRIWANALVLTDQGEGDAQPVTALVKRRLEEVGFAVVTDRDQGYDVEFAVKCEQRKVWQGTAASGGDADLPDSPLRTWRGPACQLTYYLGLKNLGWRKEVRTDFQDSIAAAKEAGAPDPSAYALDRLLEKLELYDFPVLLATDLGQEDRLLELLDAPQTSPSRKVKVIESLGQLFSAKAVPRLQRALNDPDIAVAQAAAIALGNIGEKESTASLVHALKTGRPELKIEAARGLGKVGALHGDTSIVPPLLDALDTDDITLKTEVVWALGKVPDRRSYEALLALQRSLQNVRTSDRESKEGKLWDAVSFSLKQVAPFDQIN